jgi:serine protease Do
VHKRGCFDCPRVARRTRNCRKFLQIPVSSAFELSASVWSRIRLSSLLLAWALALCTSASSRAEEGAPPEPEDPATSTALEIPEGTPPEPTEEPTRAVVVLPQFPEGTPPEPDELSELEIVLKLKHPTSISELKLIEAQVGRVVDKVMEATVGVRIGSSSGSGVIISEDGYVLTAGHVSGKPGLDVVFILHDGREVKGKTLGANHGIDSGLMKITTQEKWPFVPMAPSESTYSGQWVVAMGHPGGYMPGRAPVVRLGRVLFANKNVICTDCTLVGGDSGGPLFDFYGRVIAIHSRIGWQTTTNFHVPIATYRETWDRLLASEMWGGTFDDETAGLKPLLGVAGDAKQNPCRVRQVFPGSPAERAGVTTGDVIQKFGEEKVTNFTELAKFLSQQKPGNKVALEVDRAGKTVSLSIVLGGRHQPIPGGLAE